MGGGLGRGAGVAGEGRSEEVGGGREGGERTREGTGLCQSERSFLRVFPIMPSGNLSADVGRKRKKKEKKRKREDGI